MIRKIVAFVVLGTLVACGSSKSSKKPHIQTTKAVTKTKTRKPKTTKANATAATTNSGSTEVLQSTSRTVVYSEQVKEYVSSYKGIAQNNMKKHGIPASIILAQGILESGAGRGDLAVSANNHFGIKCHNDWTGDKVYHDDDAAQECFRKYPTAAGSFEDHALFLTGRSRYANLFKLDKDDYEGWAKGLRTAGYATDPKYPEKLIGLIERFQLAQYDEEVLDGKTKKKTEIAKEEPVIVASEKLPAMKSNTPVTNTGTVTIPADPVVISSAPATTIQQAAAQQTTGTVGVADSHTVEKGDTLYSISKKHNTTVEELIRLNGLNGNAISIGQVLKVK